MEERKDWREQRREERRQRWEDWRKRWEERRAYRGYGGAYRSSHGHIWTGVFLLLIGAAALVKATFTDLPDWVFSWQAFLVLLGFFIGIKHNFRGIAWLILIMLGGLFLVRDLYPELAIRRYIWPGILIFIGILMILRPRSRYGIRAGLDEKKNSPVNEGSGSTILDTEESWSKEDYVHTTSIFGGAKKNILSKDFKGGDIVNIFGGTELNLTQSDIRGKVPIEITTIFGGTKLIVPPNWEVKSEAVTVFGGLEDKRPPQSGPENADKTLVLRGTVFFGGIEIKSF